MTADVFNDVAVALVNYNSRAVIGQCLAPVSAAEEIVIVDNASVDDSAAFIETAFPHVQLIRSERNTGFGTGINTCIERVTKPYVLVISPDVVITPDTVGQLRAIIDRYPDAACIVPLLRAPRSSIQTWVMGPNESVQRNEALPAEGPFCTWFVSAAAILFRTAAFRAIGGFDRNIFLYQEDLDLCLQIRKSGYSMIVAPDLLADHINSGSTPPSRQLTWRKEWNFAWGTYYVMDKHGPPGAGKWAALKCVLQRAPKAAFYALVFDKKRLIRDFAWTHGALSFLFGRIPARPR